MRPRLVNDDAMALIREEARRRRQVRSNKKMARLLGGVISPSYCAKLIAAELRKHPCGDVTPEAEATTRTIE
jgi:hypothetical protein